MSQLLEFFSNHLVLTSIAFGLTAIALAYEARSKGLGDFGLEPVAAVELMNRGAEVIDMRPDEAFKKQHIKGAQSLKGEALDALMPDANLRKKTKPLLLCDAMGTTSAKLATSLRKRGRDDVYFLKGGMRAWEAEHLPVISS